MEFSDYAFFLEMVDISPQDRSLHRIRFLILWYFLIGVLLPQTTMFFYPINWTHNSTEHTLLTLILVFALISPNLQLFRGSGIEIEMHPVLSPIEIPPTIMRNHLKDLEK